MLASRAVAKKCSENAASARSHLAEGRAVRGCEQTYDDYIEVYEASKEMWQNIFRQHEMQQQLQLKSTEASAATSSDADVKAEATLDRTAPTAEGGEALSLDAKPELSEEQSERPEDGARPSAEGGEVSAEEENAQSGRELSTGESQLGGSSAVVVKTEVED